MVEVGVVWIGGSRTATVIDLDFGGDKVRVDDCLKTLEG